MQFSCDHGVTIINFFNMNFRDIVEQKGTDSSSYRRMMHAVKTNDLKLDEALLSSKPHIIKNE